MKRIIGTVMALLAAPMVYGQVDPNRTVAVINGEEIKGNEYYRRMEFLDGVGRQMGNNFAEFPPGFLTIEQLITERLILQLAKKKGVFPTDTQVDAELASQLTGDPKLLDRWTESGRTKEELTYLFQVDVARFNLLTQGITVTDQEVANFYKQNPSTFTIPRRYKLRVIAVQKATEKDVVDTDLKAGKSFADTAKAHSVELSKDQGGDYGLVPETALRDPAAGAIKNAKIGSTTDWIASGDTFVKFLVEDIVKETLRPLDDGLKREIRKKLMADRGAVKNDVSKEMATMRSEAKVDIKQKEFADAYQKFIQNYLKEHPGG